jgi:GT2 family glycosyltransferase
MVLANSASIAAPAGLVSLVIPCCGMLEYTKLCVPSIIRNTREPFELIFVDIGSLDGTVEYIAGLREGLSRRVRVEITRAPTDLKIKDAVRDALKKTRGEFVCLLNNDTVVTPKWLDALIALANVSPTHGLVGPMSNCAAEGQLVETVPYRLGPKKDAQPGDPLLDVSAVDAFARDFAGSERGKWIQVENLGGFCLLMRRVVLEQIRPALDEWSDQKLFDTNIVSAKARQAGFQCVVCRDMYIHHFGTRTFSHGAPQAMEQGA